MRSRSSNTLEMLNRIFCNMPSSRSSIMTRTRSTVAREKWNAMSARKLEKRFDDGVKGNNLIRPLLQEGIQLRQYLDCPIKGWIRVLLIGSDTNQIFRTIVGRKNKRR